MAGADMDSIIARTIPAMAKMNRNLLMFFNLLFPLGLGKMSRGCEGNPITAPPVPGFGQLRSLSHFCQLL